VTEGMAECGQESYGAYILRTGTPIIRQYELLLGAYWYQTRFAGKAPILDLGPGRCWFTRQNVKDIIAVDNAPDLVEHYRREGFNTRLGDAYKIPAPDGYFEGAFCCWLFEHLHEPDRAMREMYRVLKPSGYACVIVPTPNDMEAFYTDYTHVRPFTRLSLKQLAEDAGFTRHKTEFLPWARGIGHVLAHAGPRAASAYHRFGDLWLRKIGLVNRNNLMLETWK
jgi:SAM-dependent methyltransferase